METTTILYDNLNRQSGRLLGNGMSVSNTYDAANRETLRAYVSSTGANAYQITYWYRTTAGS